MTSGRQEPLSDALVQSLLARKMEADSLDFKLKVDTRNDADLLNLVKDVAAFANSTGGYLVIGAYAKDQEFRVPGVTEDSFLGDPTALGQKVNSYCSAPVSLSMREATAEWSGAQVRIWIVHIARAATPIVFTKSGETSTTPARRIFSKGDIYIRHNAASAPAAAYQVEALLRARGVERIREELIQLLGYDPQKSPTTTTQARSRPILNNLPQPTYSTFFGREDDLGHLLDFLNNPNRRLLTIDGIGGVGKTALARELASRVAAGELRANTPPELILWLSAKTKELTAGGPRDLVPSAMDDIYAEICRIVVPDGHEAIENPRREALAILADSPALVIIDNLETLDDLSITHLTSTVVRDFPPYTVKVVFTTRHVAIQEGGLLRLDRLSMRDATALVDGELRLRRLTISENEKERLITRTGRIPLAIKYLIGRFEQVHDVPQLVRTADQDNVLLEFIFRETFGILGQDERLVLFAASLEDSADARTLQAATGLSLQGVERAVVKLKSVSFLDYDERLASYTVSPLTRAFARTELATDLDLNLRLQQRLKRHKDILRMTAAHEALTADMQDALLLCRHGAVVMARGDLEQADEAFDRAEREFPEALSYVLISRGDACFDSGRLREALNAYLRVSGTGLEAQPRLQYRLAWLLVNVDRPYPDRAVTYCRRAVAAEPDNPIFLKLLGELEIQLEDEAAEGTLRRALYEPPRGPFQRNHNLVVDLMLAELAMAERRTRDCETYLEAAENIDPSNDRAAELRRTLRDPEIMKSIAADVRRRGKRRNR